jgi:hypothetical protein
MTLDDALSRARQERDRQDEQARLQAKWKAQAQQRMHSLGVDAVTRLAPYAGRESLHFFRVARDSQNRRTYQRAGSWWCWRIKDMENSSVIHPRLMLLVLNSDRTTAAFTVVNLDRPRTDKWQYLTTVTPDPVGPAHYSEQHPMAFFGSEWVDYLEQDVADAIVRYEREG